MAGGSSVGLDHPRGVEELAGLEGIDLVQERLDEERIGPLGPGRPELPGGALAARSNVVFRASIRISETAAGSISATCWLRNAMASRGISARNLALTSATSSWSPRRT